MKRLSYMACLLLASAAFTACDEDFKDWADPQSNPQEEAITAMVDITPVASMKLEAQPGDSVVSPLFLRLQKTSHSQLVI